MAEVQVQGWGTSDAPNDRRTKDSERLEVVALEATFDGSAAAAAFVPAVQIISDSGAEVGTFPLAGSLAVGDSATVTFAPFLRSGVGLTGIYYDFPNEGATLDVDAASSMSFTTGGAAGNTSAGGMTLEASGQLVLIADDAAFGIFMSSVGPIEIESPNVIVNAHTGGMQLAAQGGGFTITSNSQTADGFNLYATSPDDTGKTRIEQQLPYPAGANTLAVQLDGAAKTVTLESGSTLKVYMTDAVTHAARLVFQIDEDGTIHGRAAIGAMTWDL